MPGRGLRPTHCSAMSQDRGCWTLSCTPWSTVAIGHPFGQLSFLDLVYWKLNCWILNWTVEKLLMNLTFCLNWTVELMNYYLWSWTVGMEMLNLAGTLLGTKYCLVSKFTKIMCKILDIHIQKNCIKDHGWVCWRHVFVCIFLSSEYYIIFTYPSR